MQPKKPTSVDVTPESLYHNRREFLKNAALFTGVAAGLGSGLLWLLGDKSKRADTAKVTEPQPAGSTPELTIARREELAGGEAVSSFEQITTYNNFYEFGVDKSDPSAN